MGSRSGKRLNNEQKEYNRERRLKSKKRWNQRWKQHGCPPCAAEYAEIDRAIQQYIISYVRSYYSAPRPQSLPYILNPIQGREELLDINRITYNNDSCTITCSIHRKFGLHNQRFYHGLFSHPNFFMFLKVFLDSQLAIHWGCGDSSNLIANSGGFIRYCLPELEEALKPCKIILPPQSGIDPTSSCEILLDNISLGSLYAKDGFIKFGKVKEPMSWVVKGYKHALAKFVAKEVKRRFSERCNKNDH